MPATLGRPTLLAPLLTVLACGGGGGRDSADATATAPVTTTDATTTAAPTTAGPPTTGDVDPGDTTSVVDPSTSAPASTSTSTGLDSSSTGDTTGDPAKLDMGVFPCDPDDICCLMDGQIPPHKLLDAFLAMYPAADMPKTVAAVQAFEPTASGHAMAWSDENVGDELVDAANGGVIAANIEAGRALSRAAAEAALPAGAVVLEIREDPVVIEDLGTPPPCIGVGWGWGSILFEGADQSIGELVYLYIGFCSDGDVEVFYYSDQSVEVCPPPG
jgi:hypothetical protein